MRFTVTMRITRTQTCDTTYEVDVPDACGDDPVHVAAMLARSELTSDYEVHPESEIAEWGWDDDDLSVEVTSVTPTSGLDGGLADSDKAL